MPYGFNEDRSKYDLTGIIEIVEDYVESTQETPTTLGQGDTAMLVFPMDADTRDSVVGINWVRTGTSTPSRLKVLGTWERIDNGSETAIGVTLVNLKSEAYQITTSTVFRLYFYRFANK